MDNLQKTREALEATYDRAVVLLATNPQIEPRLSFESEIQVAWYCILAAREALARTISRVHPSVPASNIQTTGNPALRGGKPDGG
jgi:hypothetical protein